jgi:hypothetical protein
MTPVVVVCLAADAASVVFGVGQWQSSRTCREDEETGSSVRGVNVWDAGAVLVVSRREAHPLRIEPEAGQVSEYGSHRPGAKRLL